MRKNSRVSRLFNSNDLRGEFGLPSDERPTLHTRTNSNLKGSVSDGVITRNPSSSNNLIIEDAIYFKDGLSTYPFGTKDDKENIVFDEKGFIKSGTLVKIIEKITSEQYASK